MSHECVRMLPLPVMVTTVFSRISGTKASFALGVLGVGLDPMIAFYFQER